MNAIEKGLMIENHFKKTLPTCFVILRNPPINYENDSFEPDFLVKHNSSKIIFNVECKFRTFKNDMKHIYDFNQTQMERFKIQNDNCVLYLIGLGIGLEKPKELFIIPLNKIKPKMIYEELKPFKIISMNDFERVFITHFYLK